MDQQTFIPAEQAADQLGVAVKWLKAEAKAGRVPFIEAGRSIRFNVEQVRGVLLERARASVVRIVTRQDGSSSQVELVEATDAT